MIKQAFVAWVISASFVAGNLAGAEKQPFTVDDVYRVEQITDFKISPRGDEAVYVRHFFDVNSLGRRTAIWRIDGTTGRREPLEAGEPDGRMPVYSPNGKWLAFVSTTDTKKEPVANRIPLYSESSGGVWLLERSNPTTTIAKRRSLSLSGFQTMTDPFFGRISFDPEQGPSLIYSAGNTPQGRNDIDDPFVVPSKDDQGEGYEGYSPSKILICGGNKGTTNNPFAYLDLFCFGCLDPFWYGDPQYTPNSIICHSNRTDDQESVRYSINKNFDLWRFEIDPAVDPEKVRPKRLTTNPGPDVSPRVSPDGKHVLYLSVPRQGPHMDVFNLCVLSLEGEKPEPRMIWNAHEAERDADGTPPFQPTFPLRDDCWIDAEHVRVNGVRGMKTETMVFNIAGPEAPIAASARPEPEPSANKHFVKPDANPWLAERHLAPQEVVKWPSFDGLEIDGVLTLPPPELTQFKKPYPVIVYPHGGPHGASVPGFNNGLGLNVQVFASAGYAVFQPNYRGSYGYGRKFLDAARFEMGGSDMQDILTGVDALIEHGVVDKDRQFVYGTSYGGYSACRLVTLTDRFRAVVAQNAVTDLHAMWRLSDLQSWTEWEFGGKPWETIERDGKQIDVGEAMRDRSPTTHAHKVKTPTLLLHADHDRRCPLAMGQMFYRILKENGCPTELVVYQNERHQIWQVKHQADVLQRTLAWFAQHGK